MPDAARDAAQVAYRRFELDPAHNSLRFKKVHARLPIYSVRITRDYRAIGKRDDDGMLWFWIGTHAEYDQMLRHL